MAAKRVLSHPSVGTGFVRIMVNNNKTKLKNEEIIILIYRMFLLIAGVISFGVNGGNDFSLRRIWAYIIPTRAGIIATKVIATRE
jgi:hypothetical protein